MLIQIAIVLLSVIAPVALLYMLARPYMVFVLVVCMFSIEQLLTVYVPFLSSHGSLFNYTVGILAVTVLTIRSFRERMFGNMFNAISVLTAVLYFEWTINIFFSPGRDYVMASYFLTCAYQVLLMAVLPLLIVDLSEFRKAMVGMMVWGAIVAVLIMVNPHSSYYSGRLSLDLGMTVNGRAAVGNPLAIAELGAMIAMIAALFRPERQSQLLSLIRIAAFILGMGLAIGSGSRGQVLAAGIVGVLMYPVSRRMANPKQFFLTVFGVGFLAAGLVATFRLFIGSQNEQRWEISGMIRDTTLRLDMVWQLLNAYLSSPKSWLFGLGTNAYSSISTDQSGYVHNIAAEALCEQGVVGMCLFLTITILSIKYAIRLWKLYRHDPSMRSTVAVLYSFCLFTLFVALKQGSMGYPAPFFWWMIMAKLCRTEERRVAESAYFEHVDAANADEDAQDQLVDGEVALAY